MKCKYPGSQCISRNGTECAFSDAEIYQPMDEKGKRYQIREWVEDGTKMTVKVSPVVDAGQCTSMPADIIFDGENVDGSGTGTIKIACMHDPYDLRCPVCGHSVFSHLTNPCGITGNSFACESCGIEIALFPDRTNCRFLMEIQGA